MLEYSRLEELIVNKCCTLSSFLVIQNMYYVIYKNYNCTLEILGIKPNCCSSILWTTDYSEVLSVFLCGSSEDCMPMQYVYMHLSSSYFLTFVEHSNSEYLREVWDGLEFQTSVKIRLHIIRCFLGNGSLEVESI
jgi:hypothetical protein